MPLDQEKVDHFNDYFSNFEHGTIGKISKNNFKSFLNFFTLNQKDEDSDFEEIKDFDIFDISTPINLVGADYFDSLTTEIIWRSLDIESTGYISKDLAHYCIKGLSGYLQDFSMKLFFRILDENHQNKVSNNHLRKMRILMGMNGSEDEMIKKMQKKLGHEIDFLDYPTFYFCFKNRQTDINETAYDNDIFPNFKIKNSSEGGCCKIN